VIQAACAWAHAASIGEYEHYNGVALESLRNDHGIELRSFPEDVWSRVRAVSSDVVSSSVAGDPLAQRIYDSYAAARGRAIAWSGVADGPYLAQRSAGET
jgi:TRAP-type mannitol/chloroaromatic compound transport system substrate-binding protein